MDRTEDAVRLLLHTPHEYRYAFSSHGEMRDFLMTVRAGLGCDAGQLRWRMDGDPTAAQPAAVLWLYWRADPEPPPPAA